MIYSVCHDKDILGCIPLLGGVIIQSPHLQTCEWGKAYQLHQLPWVGNFRSALHLGPHRIPPQTWLPPSWKGLEAYEQTQPTNERDNESYLPHLSPILLGEEASALQKYEDRKLT